MSKAQTQSRPAAQPQTQNQTQQVDEAALLERMLEQPPTERYRLIDSALQKRISKVEELLPTHLKGEGERLVKRAMLTFERNEKLQKCTPSSFIRCVLQAAECGLAVDGKLAHAVPYNNKVKSNGRDVWIDEAQFQPDYKGLIAIAKRSGQIKDCYGDVVCVNDQFRHGRSGPNSLLEHSYDERAPRGEPVAAYAIIKLPDGDWRYELMQRDEVDGIRDRSKGWQAFKAGKIKSTPWSTDSNQMRIKTVIKRGLKLYCDDPGLIRAIELDDREFEGEPVQRASHKRVAVSKLNDSLNVPVAPKQSTFEQPAQEPGEFTVHREAGDEPPESEAGFDEDKWVEGENGELFPRTEGVGQ